MKTPQTGIISELESDPRYRSHFSAECAAAIAELPACSCCGAKTGLRYRGFKGRGEFRAISICIKCGDEQDF